MKELSEKLKSIKKDHPILLQSNLKPLYSDLEKSFKELEKPYKEALKKIKEKSKEIKEPCKTLVKAIDSIVAIDIEIESPTYESVQSIEKKIFKLRHETGLLSRNEDEWINVDFEELRLSIISLYDILEEGMDKIQDNFLAVCEELRGVTSSAIEALEEYQDSSLE